jgi:hypothetical protein
MNFKAPVARIRHRSGRSAPPGNRRGTTHSQRQSQRPGAVADRFLLGTDGDHVVSSCHDVPRHVLGPRLAQSPGLSLTPEVPGDGSPGPELTVPGPGRLRLAGATHLGRVWPPLHQEGALGRGRQARARRHPRSRRSLSVPVQVLSSCLVYPLYVIDTKPVPVLVTRSMEAMMKAGRRCIRASHTPCKRGHGDHRLSRAQ